MNKLQILKSLLLSTLEVKKVQLKKEFKAEFLKFEEIATIKILPIINSFVRDLIISKGRDPDYVAPKKEPHLKDVFIRSSNPSLKFSEIMPGWVRPSFKDKTKHPIYKSRMNLNTPKVEEPLEVTKATDGFLDETALDKLQSFFDILQAEDQSAFKVIDKPVPVKPVKAKSKKKPVKVKRTKKGSFRRVEE